MALRPQRSTARPTWRRITTWWLVAGALLLAGCGGGTTPEATSPPSSTPVSSSSASTTSSSSEPTGPPERSYPAGGPTDVIFPPNQPAYELITGTSGCETLLQETDGWPRVSTDEVTGLDVVEGVDTYPLYRSAAYACLGRWADARQWFAQIDTAAPSFLDNVCVRRALLAWLTDLVHESEADSAFAPVFVASTEPSPCPPDDTASTDDTAGATDTGSSVDSGSSTTTTTTTG